MSRLKTVLIRISLASVLGIGVGCTPAEEEADQGGMSDMAAALEQSNQSVAEPSSPPPEPAPAEPEAPTVVTAKTPKKGKTLHDQGSYLSAIGSARFRAEHQMILNQVTQALQLYWGTNGYYPKSHEVFMEEIVKLNMIKLPELDPGYEYWYDASDHLLKQRPISKDSFSKEETPPEEAEVEK